MSLYAYSHRNSKFLYVLQGHTIYGRIDLEILFCIAGSANAIINSNLLRSREIISTHGYE